MKLKHVYIVMLTAVTLLMLASIAAAQSPGPATSGDGTRENLIRADQGRWLGDGADRPLLHRDALFDR